MFSIDAALVILPRAAFSRPGYAFRQPQLRTLARADLWLIPALILKGGAQLISTLLATHSLHGFTIGALGFLTLEMMARPPRELESPIKPRRLKGVTFGVRQNTLF